ncbi:phosphotransferase [Natrinema marinum]|uniref:phosphotransferase n=1 Tax=Natrinema marinum TaxID=2961598 RepID=UPI0020C8B99A|nr:phosphotransferase [Natrinema marinum]
MLDQSATDILIVPSAVLVPDELRLDVGSIPTGLIPLQGRPILERIADTYEEIDLTKVVAVSESGDLIREYVDRSAYEWEVIDVGETVSVGDTILRTLESLSVEMLANSDLYINFADTLVEPVQRVSGRDYISYTEEDRSYRWTTFDISGGEIDTVTEKYSSVDEGTRPTFVGQFGITNARAFQDDLKVAVETNSQGLDPFYQGLLSYLSDHQYSLREPDVWLDVGHLDTYHRAAKEFLNAREFNELEVNEKNVIAKHSDDTSTLISEINWYNQIPNQLQPYLPRLYDWSTDVQDPYIEMEYIGYPSLSDLQLYGSHGDHIWDNVFHRLFDMLAEFRQFKVESSSSVIQNSLKEIYLAKTRRRLSALHDSGRADAMFEAESVCINGRSYPDVSTILEEIEDLVYSVGLLDQEEFSVIHGDLCFPNILYDPRNGILKLIDPRGEFGEFTIYGDPRYDVAKLRHSVAGHYEHLINGRFSASYDPESASIDYEIYTTDRQKARKSHFDALLEERDGISLKTVKLVEGLLFLSMVPLHADSPSRQQCMLAQGIEKVAPYLE